MRNNNNYLNSGGGTPKEGSHLPSIKNKTTHTLYNKKDITAPRWSQHTTAGNIDDMRDNIVEISEDVLNKQRKIYLIDST